jgi:alginate O-acetyltransferase complex protein AlgI
MTFAKLEYFAVFLTIGWLVYFCIPSKYRYIFLLGFSSAILYLIDGWLVVFIIAEAFFVYAIGLWIQKITDKEKLKRQTLDRPTYLIYRKKAEKTKNCVMLIGVLGTLLSLILFKYTNTLIKIINKFGNLKDGYVDINYISLLIPIGISYYSLQSISYVIDIKRGKYKAETNVFKLCLFICYFPQMFEGPIGRYDRLKPTLLDGDTSPSEENYTSGLLLIAFGMFKKLVIADRLAGFTSEIFKNFSIYSGWVVLLAVLSYTIRLYCDFSGVIDMVTGTSKCFGIELDKNFRQPFFSTSVGEFWRRWHISLGEWFKDYVFYPMSMSKFSFKINKRLISWKFGGFWSSFFPMAVTMIIVWSLTGIWHGTQLIYIFYGLYYGLIIIFETIFEHYFGTAKKPFRKFLSIVITFIFVNIGMLIFFSGSIEQFKYMISSIFVINETFVVPASLTINDGVVLFFSILALFLVDYFKEKNNPWIGKISKCYSFRLLFFAVLVISIAIYGAFGQGYNFLEPIYDDF